MAATALPPTFTSYRNAVADLMESGQPFADVEHAIDGCELSEDLKAALWLVAYFNDGPPAAYGPAL